MGRHIGNRMEQLDGEGTAGRGGREGGGVFGSGWHSWRGRAQLEGDVSGWGHGMIEGTSGWCVVGLGWHRRIGMEKLEGAQLDWEGTTDWGGTAGWVWRRSGMAQLDLMGWLEEGIAGSGGHSWIGMAKLQGGTAG